MANTVTTTTLSRQPHKVVLYVTILSDGTEESATLIYDSSAQCALIKDPQETGAAIPDPLNCRILAINSQFATVTGTAHLLFDATTDVLAIAIPPNNMDSDFRYIGGLPNYAGSGKTGDILLTTNTMAAGDMMTFILEVQPA